MKLADSLNRLPYVPARHREKWTKTEMLDLAEYYLNNDSWKDISTKLERTEGACKNRLYMMKVAFGIHQQLQDSGILAMLVPQPVYSGAVSDKEKQLQF